MIFIKKIKPVASCVLDTYWHFAAERQEIFFNRIAGKEILTTDPILLKHKFTNAYRASDRVSQFLIKEVIETGDQDRDELLFRILLFKLFNKIETWQLLQDELGVISWKQYQFETYNRILSEALAAGERIYSAAYMMASGKSSFGYDKKHQNHLKLLELMFKGNLPVKIEEAKSFEAVYQLLLSYPAIGGFLAYQFAIDINYSSVINFSEMDFVMPGPGARDGIRKCFSSLGDYNEAGIISYVTDMQQQEFDRLGIHFKNLWGRPLQLIDCQNLFCETDKYARVAHPEISGISDRKRIKQVYAKKSSLINYYYPAKWGINKQVQQNCKS